MKYKAILEVTIESSDKELAEHDLNSLIRIKNQLGCEVNGSQFTFSIKSGIVEQSN